MTARGTLVVEDLAIRALADGGRALVQRVSFDLAPGESLVLLGESGSGKTLVAQAVMGTLPAELAVAGRVVLDGVDLLKLPPRQRRALWGRRIALLPQEPWLALDPTMRAAPQVSEVHALVRGRPWSDARARAARALVALGLAPPAQRRFPHHLSGGMCQRVAFAAAHAAAAPLLPADEPTKGLDAALRDEVAEAPRAEAAAGRAVLVITHDLTAARIVGGAALVLLDGRVVEYGSVQALLHAPRHDYTRALVAALPEHWPARQPGAVGDVAVQAIGAGRSFAGGQVLRDVELAVRRGEIVAVTGPSGSGKSTLGNLLAGLLAPTSGRVICAPSIGPLQLQKLYQDPSAAFAPHQALGRGLADLAARHGLPRDAIGRLLAQLRLPAGLLDRRPDQVSGGELQRVALARALALEPAFLFADEPTSRLDPIIQRTVMTLLAEVAAERRLALLLVTHEAAMAHAVADRVVPLASSITTTEPALAQAER